MVGPDTQTLNSFSTNVRRKQRTKTIPLNHNKDRAIAQQLLSPGQTTQLKQFLHVCSWGKNCHSYDELRLPGHCDYPIAKL